MYRKGTSECVCVCAGCLARGREIDRERAFGKQKAKNIYEGGIKQIVFYTIQIHNLHIRAHILHVCIAKTVIHFIFMNECHASEILFIHSRTFCQPSHTHRQRHRNYYFISFFLLLWHSSCLYRHVPIKCVLFSHVEYVTTGDSTTTKRSFACNKCAKYKKKIIKKWLPMKCVGPIHEMCITNLFHVISGLTSSHAAIRAVSSYQLKNMPVLNFVDDYLNPDSRHFRSDNLAVGNGDLSKSQNYVKFPWNLFHFLSPQLLFVVAAQPSENSPANGLQFVHLNFSCIFPFFNYANSLSARSLGL